MREAGLRLVAIDYDDKGHARLKFHAKRSRIRELVVVVASASPTKLVYGYSIWDPQTKTVTGYHGPYGDPARDEVGDLLADDLE